MQRDLFLQHWQLILRPAAAATGTAGDAKVCLRYWPFWSLALLGLIAAVDALWLAATPISLSTEGLFAPLIFAALTAVLLYRLRLPPRLHMLLSGLALMLVAWPALRLYNHLVMTTALPLTDVRLAGWDSALGLDWLGYVLWLDRHPALLRLMDMSYAGLTIYSCLAFALILILLGAERAREFVLLFLLTAVAASTVGMFFPALAAMTFHAPDASLFQTLTPASGAYHLESLDRLRTEAAPLLELHRLPGLTTFPSFHTAMGLVVIHCARGSRLLLVPMLLLNLLMIASTPALGSHYFVDVLGGAALAAAAILVLRRLDRRRSAQS